MGDYIDIKEGITINLDLVEAIIESKSDKDKDIKCKVYISGVGYPSKLAKSDLLIRIANKGVRKGKSVQEQVLNIMKQTTNVMGG
jgi:hypothetical protein